MVFVLGAFQDTIDQIPGDNPSGAHEETEHSNEAQSTDSYGTHYRNQLRLLALALGNAESDLAVHLLQTVKSDTRVIGCVVGSNVLFVLSVHAAFCRIQNKNSEGDDSIVAACDCIIC